MAEGKILETVERWELSLVPCLSLLTQDTFLLWLCLAPSLSVAPRLHPGLETTKKRTHVFGTILIWGPHGLLSWCPRVPLKR